MFGVTGRVVDVCSGDRFGILVKFKGNDFGVVVNCCPKRSSVFEENMVKL